MDGGTPEVRALAGRLIDRETALCVAPPPAVATAVIDQLYDERGAAPSFGSGADEGSQQGAADGGRVTRPPADDATVRLLVPDGETDRLFAAFDETTAAAELVERDELAVRTIDTASQRVTVTDEQAYAHVRADDTVRSLAVEEEGFRSSVAETYERQWTASRPAEVPAPARSRLLRTFADAFPEAAETLAAVLSAEPSVERDGPLDPVTAVTLVAARHRVQTLELSEWAEGLGFSSRTELSRVTNRLEERGLIATERVPHGVGRPRQRLGVARDALADCPPSEFVAVARREYDA